MATNKRKDAAALFELIDRSTLKVPKNAGALKIPAWWSSKTNPPSTAATARPIVHPAFSKTVQPAAKGEATTSAAVAVARAPAAVPEVVPAKTEVVAEAPEAAEPQARLFDPPPVNAAPGASPSFRPPVARAAAPLPVAAPVAESDVPLKETEAISETELEKAERAAEAAPEERAVPKVFAPHTFAPDRKAWSPANPGALARLPGWVMVAGVALLVMVASLIIYQAKKPKNVNGTQAATGGVAGPVETRGTGTVIAVPPMTGVGQVATRGGAQTTVQTQGGGRSGRIYAENVVAYVPEQYYVIVCSTPSKTIAQRNAGWLAEQGVDVAVEVTNQQNRFMYTLVALRGFASASAALPFQQEIVRIGELHSKEAKDAFKTAYAKAGLRSAQAAPAAATRGARG